MRLTIACTGVREPAGFEIENLSRVPGDAQRYPTECVRPEQVQQFAETNLHKSIRNGSFLG